MDKENFFDLARAYYTFLKTETKKEQCSVSIVCENADIKQCLIDGFLFSGAMIFDGLVKNTDGVITIKEEGLYLKNCKLSDLKYDDYVSNANGTVIKK